jgi:uncharacterized protein (DUF1501 family)
MLRREFIKTLAGSLVLFQSASYATVKPTQSNKKIIWIVLRGAYDSLHTLVPRNNADLTKLRPNLYKHIKNDLLVLNNEFGLHPSLKNMHQWYKNKELLPITSVGTGFTNRSHFDGQDFLESGLDQIDSDSGWLARAIDAKQAQALAVARSTPISLRSSNKVNTWFPTKFKESHTDTYDALSKLYEYDELLMSRLQSGIDLQNKIGKSNSKKGRFSDLAKSCANLMVKDNSIDCAMLELGGWDTHNNQNARLARQLTLLDDGLAELKSGLGKQWQDTVVIVASEFGRTVKQNGTSGTDHGTGNALFLAGGAVNGGQVLGKWPGLKTEQLFEQRDLMPTSNTFSWIANVLEQHWGLTPNQLKSVLPNAKRLVDKVII